MSYFAGLYGGAFIGAFKKVLRAAESPSMTFCSLHIGPGRPGSKANPNKITVDLG